jgi:hypothetical protein
LQTQRSFWRAICQHTSAGNTCCLAAERRREEELSTEREIEIGKLKLGCSRAGAIAEERNG